MTSSRENKKYDIVSYQKQNGFRSDEIAFGLSSRFLATSRSFTLTTAVILCYCVCSAWQSVKLTSPTTKSWCWRTTVTASEQCGRAVLWRRCHYSQRRRCWQWCWWWWTWRLSTREQRAASSDAVSSCVNLSTATRNVHGERLLAIRRCGDCYTG